MIPGKFLGGSFFFPGRFFNFGLQAPQTFKMLLGKIGGGARPFFGMDDPRLVIVFLGPQRIFFSLKKNSGKGAAMWWMEMVLSNRP